MQRNPVGWFEIYVSDMARARRFYEAMLSCALNPLPAPASLQTEVAELWAFPAQMDAPGAPGALVRMPGCTPGVMGGTLVYFSCADCAEQVARVVAAGGEVIRDKTSIEPYGFVAHVRDTEGNVIGLHSLR